jgi:pyridoxine 5-phosphate synthase
MVKLGVNIDHVATLRQARGGEEPNVIYAARVSEEAGCNSIVVHLREDRRHINDEDLKSLRKNVKTRLNLEMSILDEIVNIACQVRPDQATLVPEKRKEITTEGGLDIALSFSLIKEAVNRLTGNNIVVSLFIDPDRIQIEGAKDAGAPFIELHTGEYANAKTNIEIEECIAELIDATQFARSLGLKVNAGHGLNYKNVKKIARIEGIEDWKIAHSIISRAVFLGLGNAVREMLVLLR